MIDKAEVLRRINFKDFYSEQIPSLKLNGKPNALGICPFHNDHNPSLSVNIETGLYNCLSSCGAKGSVFDFYMQKHGVAFHAALKALAAIAGVTDTVNGKSKVVATFDYHNEDGSLRHQKDRIEPGKAGRPKDFFFHHIQAGKKIYQRNGNPVLYHLNEIILAQEIYILEGEGKADLLRSWGLTATCLDSGGNSKWRYEYTEIFLGKDIIIVPDKDNPGTTYGRSIITNTKSVAASIKLVRMPGTAEVNDILDWIKLPGNDRAAFLKIVADTNRLNTEEEIKNGDIQEPQHLALTDAGNAERFVAQHKGTLRFNKTTKRWMQWTGEKWDSSDHVLTMPSAIATARSMLAEAYKAGGDEAILKWAKKSEGLPALKAMASISSDMPEIATVSEDFDTDPEILNCKNGVIDLRTGKLLQPNPESMLSKSCGIDYDPEALCPETDKFMDTVFGSDTDLINYVWGAIGYSLSGQTYAHCMFLLYGEGGNGKSRFVHILNMLTGDYGGTLSGNALAQRHGDPGISNDVAGLESIRCATAAEAANGKFLDETLLKELTGGDRITARLLMCNNRTFKPIAKLWLACNHEPGLKGTDTGIRRRMRKIPFLITIPKEEQLADHVIDERHRQELPGILAKAVRSYKEWQQGEPEIPFAVAMATDEYIADQDVLGRYMSERCTMGEYLPPILQTTLYNDFVNWGKSSGERYAENISKNKLTMELKRKGIHLAPGNNYGRRYKGINLNPEILENNG